MEIGTPEDSELTFIPQSPEKPVVLYGTSIAQGPVPPVRLWPGKYPATFAGLSAYQPGIFPETGNWKRKC